MTTTDTPTTGTEQGSETVREYNIPASLEAAARNKVAKVNRRLTRLGLPLYQVDIRPGTPVIRYDDMTGPTTVIDGVPHHLRAVGDPEPCAVLSCEDRVEVTVTGATPRLADWEPVAVLTREQGGPVITRVWPGLATEPDLTPFRGTDPTCEHCHTARHRNDTYVVRHLVTGEMRQVGRNCLAAFTGVTLNIPVWLTDGSDGLDDMESWGGGDADVRWSVSGVLATACAVVALAGWVSRSQARESFTPIAATADLVLDALGGRSEACRKLRRDLEPLMADAIAQAPTVHEHAKTMAERERGEYPANLSTIANLEWVTTRNIPLLVSAVSAFHRHQERVATAATAGTSTCQGAVGDKLAGLALTVTATHTIPTQYGTTTLIVMADDTGNKFKWFASGHHTYAPGETLTVKGTVKAHGEYQGIAETVLTRCKVADRTVA